MRADERREGVPLELNDRHLGAVKAVPVGDLQQAGVAAGVGLEPGRQHFEQLVDEVLLLRGREGARSAPAPGLRGATRGRRGPGGRGGGTAILTVSQKSAMRMARSLVSPSLAYSMS